MATEKDIDAPLTLEIDGGAVSPDKFLRAVTAFFEIIREVAAASGHGDAADWRVQVKMGSNLVGAYPDERMPREVVDTIQTCIADGIAGLESAPRKPRWFTERALKNIKKLGQVAGEGEGDTTTIRVWAGKRAQSVTRRSVAHVSEIVEADFEEHGSISGRLQTISDRGGIKFVLYEALWDHPVRCIVPEHLIDAAVAAFRKRVEVYGSVKYRQNGTPVSVLVRELDVLPDAEILPSFEDVRGILRDAG